MTKMTYQMRSRLIVLVLFVFLLFTFFIGNIFGWFGTVTYIYDPTDIRFPENGLSVTETGDSLITITDQSNITGKSVKFNILHTNDNQAAPDEIAFTLGFQFNDNLNVVKDNVTFISTLTYEKRVNDTRVGNAVEAFINEDLDYLQTYITDLLVLEKYENLTGGDKHEYFFTLSYALSGIQASAVGAKVYIAPKIAAFYKNTETENTGGGVVGISSSANIDEYIAARKDNSTLALSTNVVYPKTLRITDFANSASLNLGNNNLTINGDLIFEYGGTTKGLINLAGGGILTVNGDLIIKTPNASFEIRGNYPTTTYSQLKINGKIYLDAEKKVSSAAYDTKHTVSGLYIKALQTISLEKDAEFLGADIVILGSPAGSANRIFIDEDSFLGLIVAERRQGVGAPGVSYVNDVEIINYGDIGFIDLKNVSMRSTYVDHLIEIYNDGEITGRYDETDDIKYHVSIPTDSTYSTFGALREVVTQGNTYMEVGLNSNLYRTAYKGGTEFYSRKMFVDIATSVIGAFQTEHVLQFYSRVHFLYWEATSSSGVAVESSVMVNYGQKIPANLIPKEGATWFSRTLEGVDLVSTALDGEVNLETFVVSSDMYLYEIISFSVNYGISNVDKAGFTYSSANFASNNQILYDGGEVYENYDGITLAAPAKENYIFEGWALENNKTYQASSFITYDSLKKGYHIPTAALLENGSWDVRTGTYAVTVYSYWDPFVIRLIRGNTIIDNYNNFAAPYDAAEMGDRIEMLNDYYLQADWTIDKNITLDLSNFHLTLKTGVDLVIKQGSILGHENCFITDAVDTTIEIYAAADASKITGYINGISGQTFYRSKTTKYISKFLGGKYIWCEYFTVKLFKPWMVQSPDVPEATLAASSTYYSASIVTALEDYSDSAKSTSWVPLATFFVEWEDINDNRISPTKLAFITSDTDLYIRVNPMAAISISGTSEGTTKKETMVLKNTMYFSIASVGNALNITNTTFTGKLGDNSSWKLATAFSNGSGVHSAEKFLSLVNDTTEGEGVITATYPLIDRQTSAAISIRGQTTVQGTWTAQVRYPEITYALNDPVYGGKWQFTNGPADVLKDVDLGTKGIQSFFKIDTYSDIPEVFAADFYHYLDNTTYARFDAYKIESGRDYYDFRNYDNKLLVAYVGRAAPSKGLLADNIYTFSGDTFSRRDSNGDLLDPLTLGGQDYWAHWAAISSLSVPNDPPLTGNHYANDGYANFLFQNIKLNSWDTLSYDISGGFLGTEPYKSKYKSLTDLFVAYHCAKYYEGATYALDKFVTATNNATDPQLNRTIKTLFAWGIEAYFLGTDQHLLPQENPTLNSHNRSLLMRDVRIALANTNINYSFSSTGTTTNRKYTMTASFSNTYPSGDFIQRGGPDVITLGYHTDARAFLYDLIQGLSSSSTVNNSTPMKTSAGGNKLYSFIGWSTVNPATVPGGYKYDAVPRHSSDPNKTCMVCDGYVNGDKPQKITEDTLLYPIYKLSSRMGKKVWMP